MIYRTAFIFDYDVLIENNSDRIKPSVRTIEVSVVSLIHFDILYPARNFRNNPNYYLAYPDERNLSDCKISVARSSETLLL